MARPLQKHKSDGTLYTRFPDVEAAIDAATALDRETLIARAELRKKSAAGFLPKEALIHLIREAKRADDQTTLAKLFTILLRRCEAILLLQVPDSYPHAADIRGDTLSELGELVATDQMGADPDRLDFFEISFHGALVTLRCDVRRRYARRRKHEAVPAASDDPEDAPIEETLEADGTPESLVFATERLGLLNRLPAADRELLLLRFANDITVESNDPDEPTLAKLYGVEGRTIRNRLNAARSRLAELEKSHDE